MKKKSNANMKGVKGYISPDFDSKNNPLISLLI